MRRLAANQKLLAALGLIVIILISIPLAKNLSRRHEINQEIRDLEAEINSIEKKNTDLKKLVKFLESDEFAEEQARLNLGLKKAGEEVAMVSDGSVKPADGVQENAAKNIFTPLKLAPNPAEPESNPKKWWSYFIK